MIHALYGAGHAAENALYRRLVGCELRAPEVMNGFVEKETVHLATSYPSPKESKKKDPDNIGCSLRF